MLAAVREYALMQRSWTRAWVCGGRWSQKRVRRRRGYRRQCCARMMAAKHAEAASCARRGSYELLASGRGGNGQLEMEPGIAVRRKMQVYRCAAPIAVLSAAQRPF
jgi:hypothetical protein